MWLPVGDYDVRATVFGFPAATNRIQVAAADPVQGQRVEILLGE